MNIREALIFGKTHLRRSDSADIDSQYLLCHVLECDLNYLHIWSDKSLSLEQKTQFEDLLSQRQMGKPIAYLIGQRGFWTLDLKVTEDTLIPRPDTELLVSLALEKITPEMTVADLGTGTGAIALSLAQEHPEATVFSMDYSAAALRVARENRDQYQLNNVHFWQGSWLTAITDQCLDMIISNPPYIEDDDEHLKQGDIRFEPLQALASGTDGLDDIRQIITQATRCLKPSAYLLIEHGYHQAQQIVQLFNDAGFYDVRSEQDLGGNDRVVMGRLKV